MKTNRTIGSLLVIGAVALLVPYTLLTLIFRYPAILREDTAVILTRFHEGGSRLILTWFAFAVTGLPLIPAYLLMGQQLESSSPLVRTATTAGIIGLIVQMIGLLRWTFVVPVLSAGFVHATDSATRAAAVMAFKTIHQYGGVVLGEHLGQLFTIAWTVMMSVAFLRLKMLPRWLGLFGLLSSAVYLLAQLELFATVMPGVPVWSMAGFLGSTLWLIWLIMTGVFFFRRKS